MVIMHHNHRFPALLVSSLLIILTCFVHNSLCDEPTDFFTSCLMQNKVHNFTSHSNAYNDSSVYFQLLSFSIQNLRFSEPWLPKPIALVFPGSKEQLMSTVVCARKSSLEIRVRCGGHSYEGISYVTADGAPFVVIDMTNLDRVSVDKESEFAWVEGGATLGQTYYAIAEASSVHGFSAGSCPTVGVGGHISGGGFGLLSRKYGLAADNVLDALLVNADGVLLDREAMGEEVFWAIRGGGGGVFGIVYAWKIRMLGVPKTVTSFIVSRPGTKRQVANLVQKWQHVAPKLDDGFYLASFVGAGLPQRKEIGISTTFKGFYLGQRSKAMAIMNRVFPELRILEAECEEMSWIESILYFAGLDSKTTVLDLKNRYGGVMQNISSEAIAFPHREGNIFTIQYLVEWKQADNAKSSDYVEWIRGFYSSMTPYVSSGPRAAYVNYMDLDLGVMELIRTSVSSSSDAVKTARAWGEKYFLKNYDRLVRAKTAIDPNNVFRHQQGIPLSQVSLKLYMRTLFTVE